MVQKWFAFFAAALAAACVSMDDDGPIQFLDYGCDDLVVVGRVETVGSTLLDDPRNILGASVWDMQIRVKRVIRGTERRKTIPVTGLAHAQIRDDVDFLIVLAKAEGAAGYSMVSANLASYTRPASSCSDLEEDS